MPAYCTVADLKAWSDRTSASLDTELAAVIDTTGSWIDEYCQRTFEVSASDPREFQVCHPFLLRFGVFNDLQTITSLKTDEAGDGTFETVWSAADYELLPLNRGTLGPEPRPATALGAVNRCFPYSWSRGRSARIEVTGTWGWAAVPPAVRQAALIQASRVVLRRHSPDGVIGGFQDFGPVRVSGRVDPDVADLLGPYRHPMAAVLVA